MIGLEHLPEGRQIRVARVAAGLTQYDLAKLADVHPTRLSDHERGVRKLSPDAVQRVRDVLSGAGQGQRQPMTTAQGG